MSEYLRSLNNLARTTLHDGIVRRDVRLAFCAVNDQRVNAELTVGGELNGRRESCTAETCDTGLTNALDELRFWCLTPILKAF